MITLTDITLLKGHEQALETINHELDQRVATRTVEVRRLSRVFQDAADPIIIEDLQGRIVDMNEEAAHAYGWSRQELIGRSATQLVPPEQHRQIDELAQLCRAGRALRNVESWRVTKDSRMHPVLITLTLLSDEAGAPSEIATLAKDITELRAVERQLAQLGDHERQQLGRALHDTLGQQISSAALLVAALRKHPAGAAREEIVTKLEALTDEAKQHIRAFLKGLVPVDVDADGLRVALTELAKETTEWHELTCHFECLEDVPLHDNFTATQLYLIAREAVFNAVKHAGANEIVIRLQNDAGIIRLSVSDDGRGIPLGMELRTTMGVRIMRYRSGLVGGTFALESTPAGGTAVTCSLRLP